MWIVESYEELNDGWNHGLHTRMLCSAPQMESGH